jgi:hypothetical protein
MIHVDPKFPNVIPAAIVVDDDNPPAWLPSRVIPLTLDSRGRLRIAGSVSATLGTSLTLTDNLVLASAGVLGSVLYALDGATYDRLRVMTDAANAQAALTAGNLSTMAKLMAVHVTDGDFDRLAQSGCNTDANGPFSEGLLLSNVHERMFNGTAWDRKRSNFESTLLASAARTATVASADQTNWNGKGAHVIINVTAIAATPSVVPTIQGKDPVSGSYYDILVGNAITATGMTVLKVYPGIGVVVAGAASDILPRVWRVNMTHADADSITYSVAAVVVN